MREMARAPVNGILYRRGRKRSPGSGGTDIQEAWLAQEKRRLQKVDPQGKECLVV